MAKNPPKLLSLFDRMDALAPPSVDRRSEAGEAGEPPRTSSVATPSEPLPPSAPSPPRAPSAPTPSPPSPPTASTSPSPLAPIGAKVEQPPLTVTQLVTRLRATVERSFVDVRVIGEVSQFSPWRNGNWYFDLKDDGGASLPCVMFARDVARLKFKTLAVGLQLLARGRVSVFPQQGKVQLLVEKIEPVGAGALALAFQELKERLEKEGLFDQKRKRRPPTLPKRVGVVTSPQGAALKDVIKVLRHRMPQVSITVAPTRVQGEGAAADVARSLAHLDRRGGCDVVLLVRGGGSAEDLSAFNDEAVARAIVACRAPVICGVGHESDVTIADLVADLRAATPSQAAELAVPRLVDVIARLRSLEAALHERLRARLDRGRVRLSDIEKRLANPRLLVFPAQRRLDLLEERLETSAQARFDDARARLAALDARLRAQDPARVVHGWHRRLDGLRARLLAQNPHKRIVVEQAGLTAVERRLLVAVRGHAERARRRLVVVVAQLHALSPLAVLERGYVLAHDVEGHVVRRAQGIAPGDALRVRFVDGTVEATVVSNAPVVPDVDD